MNTTTQSSSFEKAIRTPFRIIDFCFVVSFLIAVVHVCWNERRIDWVFLFLVPPLWAWVWTRSPRSRLSTKLIAAVFLALISLGDVVACFNVPVGNHLSGLSRHENIVLEWYVLVYLLYLFALLPPVLFMRPLIDRWRQRATYFHPVTCCLGLLVWLIMGPFAIYTFGHFLMYGPIGGR